MDKHFDVTKESKGRNHWKTLKTLGYYLWPEQRRDLKLRVVIALVSLAMAKVVNVYVPFLYKKAVDTLSTDNIMLVLPLGIIFAYGAARILHHFFGEFRDFIFEKVSRHAQRAIALNTFKHLHELSLRFHLDRQTGGLSRVIERGTQGIQFLLSFVLFNILPTLLEILMVTVILFYKFDIRFAAVTFLSVTIYIIFTLFVTEWRLKFRREMNEKDSDANTKSIDSLLNYETVKYFCNEGHEYTRFDKALEGYERAAIRSQTSLSLLNMGQGTIIGIGLIIVMVMAGSGVVAGEYTIGDFVLVNTFLIQLYLPLNFLGFVYRQIKQSLIDMDKMFELLEVNAEIQDSPHAKPLTVDRGQVVFDQVCFGYNDNRSILHNISFIVPSGKTVAIVGPSGAGKSTISRLLYRFYDPGSGSVRIDGQDIRNVSQHSLRSAIGIVPQDTVLFNDSIGYNIQYGLPGVSHNKVVEAAKIAKIHDFVQSLPDGYDTIVGERGLKLSGGEKQRVSIARTILKNPLIMLFDEATSALDSNTEKEIQASLREVSQDRTTLVIAHRLSTIVDADEILVLKNGVIVESGYHNELLNKGGEYAFMWTRQQEAREYQSKLAQTMD
jgi:ABC-type transport system involved in Fe-S cluster assembly fused permease/ATPase subunit